MAAKTTRRYPVHLKTIDAVLFDLDETLIQNPLTLEALCCGTFDCFAEKLAPVSREQFWRVFFAKAMDMWRMMLDGVIDGDTAHRYTFINTLRTLELDEALADALKEHGAKQQAEMSRLFDDTLPVLARLREAGKKTAIITNGYAVPQRLKINRHGLADHVDAVFVSAETGAHKPSRKIFEFALAHLGVAPEKTVYLGDMPDIDIVGARGAGMHALLVDPHDRWAKLEDVPRLRRLTELLPILGLAI